MKRLILLTVLGLLVLSGCGKYDKEDALKDFSKMVKNTDSYNIKGDLEILGNDEIFKYDVDVSYKEGDYYKVNLKNISNLHEQIILKNDEGVYVITPKLNKSFKFQSEWPKNSSQSYILETLLTDLQNDKNKTFVKKDNKYIFKTEVNYPNNRNLVKEIITLDKKMNLKQVEVLDSDGTVNIKFKVTSFDKKINYKNSYFSLKNNVKETDTSETEENKTETNENKSGNYDTNESNTDNAQNDEATSGNIDEVIYPMFLPANTKFESEEKVSTEGSERVILNFKGDKSFTLVEETVSSMNEFEVVPVYGEITFLNDSVGAITSTSLNWTSGNKEYYLVGENLSEEDLINIASSTTSVSINK